MMEALQYILLYIGAVVCVAHIYDLTYRFQIKEYRLDRFFVFLREVGIIRAIYALRIRFPSKSLRNLLVIALSVLLLSLVVFYVQEGTLIRTVVFVILAPFVSLVLTALTVLLTEIFAQIKRKGIISQAKRHLALSKTVVIGITGSYGKTTTKEFLYQILSRRFRIAKTEANMNTDVGIALSILKNVTPETDFFIAEMGAYTTGEIEKACRIAPPKYGILTAIGNQHLALFGSHEKLLEAKKELLKAVPPKGRIYLNKSIKDRSVLARGIMASIVLYSTTGKADAAARKSAKNTYEVQYRKKKIVVNVLLSAPYALENLLPCIALALDLGMKEKEIQTALKTLKNLPDKFAHEQGVKGIYLILDTGNSNVEGFLSAIDALTEVKRPRKYAVSKGIIELGNEKDSSYKKILAKLAKNKVALLTTDKLFRLLDVSNNVQYFEDEGKLLSHLLSVANKKTSVLLEGRFTPHFIRSITKGQNQV